METERSDMRTQLRDQTRFVSDVKAKVKAQQAATDELVKEMQDALARQEEMEVCRAHVACA